VEGGAQKGSRTIVPIIYVKTKRPKKENEGVTGGNSTRSVHPLKSIRPKNVLNRNTKEGRTFLEEGRPIV